MGQLLTFYHKGDGRRGLASAEEVAKLEEASLWYYLKEKDDISEKKIKKERKKKNENCRARRNLNGSEEENENEREKVERFVMETKRVRKVV